MSIDVKHTGNTGNTGHTTRCVISRYTHQCLPFYRPTVIFAWSKQEAKIADSLKNAALRNNNICTILHDNLCKNCSVNYCYLFCMLITHRKFTVFTQFNYCDFSNVRQPQCTLYNLFKFHIVLQYCLIHNYLVDC